MSLVQLQLFRLLQGYLSLQPPNNLAFPRDISPHAVHDFLLRYILLHRRFNEYPPSSEYQQSFWKWAIKNLETLMTDQNEEIDSRIYDHYLSLISSIGSSTRSQGIVQHRPPSESFVTYFWNSSAGLLPSGFVDLDQLQSVTLLESRTTIESGTTGLRTWFASHVLAQYIFQHPDLVADKQVLELGSGIGFLGVVIASLQQRYSADSSAAVLWLTDVDETVLTRCKQNVMMPCNPSSIHPAIHFKLLDWNEASNPDTNPASFLENDLKANLVIGADIIFDPDLIPPLISVLGKALCTENSIALIAAAVRNERTFSRFLECAQASAIHVEDLFCRPETPTLLEAVDYYTIHDRVRVFQMRLKRQRNSSASSTADLHCATEPT